jgi:hypothetical protein
MLPEVGGTIFEWANSSRRVSPEEESKCLAKRRIEKRTRRAPPWERRAPERRAL